MSKKEPSPIGQKGGDMKSIELFEKNINYTFKNKDLLYNALTHTSYAYENNERSNEKLEFLGDAILEFVTSEYLYKNYRKLREGEMTKVRASVVCEQSLHKVAVKLGFSDFLRVGRSEIVNHGNEKPAIMADAVEAVIAAMFLDSNIEQVKNFIIDNLCDAIKLEIIAESGPDHNKKFTAQVKYNGQVLAQGSGKSKKEAETEAAKFAIENHKV